MSELPMDDELRALIDLEKQEAAVPDAARERLAARLGPLLATTALAAGAAALADDAPGSIPRAPVTAGRAAVAANKFGWTALAVAASTGAIVGSVATAVVTRGTAPPSTSSARVEVRYVERPAPPASPSETPPTEAIAASALPAAPSAKPILPATGPAKSDRSDRDLARERQLVDQARAALARGDADAALSAVDEHARSFSDGQLVEMREALAVQALVQAHEGPRARARAGRFHQRFPGSVYGAAVDAALASIP